MALRFNKLTRQAVRALVAGDTITEHGISARRMATGDLAYSINVMVDGRRIHRVIGRESAGVTREQAERAIETISADARAERLNLPSGRKTHRSFAEAARSYLDRLEIAGGKDLRNKRRHLEQQLIPYFQSTRINKITSVRVGEYVQYRLRGTKQATVNRELSTMGHLLNRMVEWKWLKAQDKPRIIRGTEARKPITVLSEQDEVALLQAALTDSDPHLHLFVAFGLNAAMRHSEIVRIRYEDIDFDGRRVFIPQAKAGEREQPITPTLVALLRERRSIEGDRDGWVFPAKASARSEAARLSHRPSMEYGFKRAVEAANLDPKKVTPHVMRHTAITKLVKAGVDLPTIQRISGHKTLAMVMRYVHIHGSHIDTAVDKLDTGSRPITPKLHQRDQPSFSAAA